VITLLVFWNPLTNCLKVIIDWLRNMQNDLFAYIFSVQNAPNFFVFLRIRLSSQNTKRFVPVFISSLGNYMTFLCDAFRYILYIKTKQIEKVQLIGSIPETEMIELLTTTCSSLTKRKLGTYYLLSWLMFCPNPFNCF